MSGRRNRQQERQRAIAARVTTEGTMRIEAVAEAFGVSLMTAHRDLDELAALGLLHKQRGQVSAHPSSLVESSDVYRQGQLPEVKASLAAAAAELVEPGQAILLDDSTTTLAVVPHLLDRAPLTVATNYVPAMTALMGQPDVTLIGLSGQYHAWANAFLGDLTIQAIGRLRTDLLLMSTSAVVDGTCCHQSQETVETKRAMLAAAATRVLLVDRTKFERRALHALCPLEEFDHVIVDAATPEAVVEDLVARGIDVRRASRSQGPLNAQS